MKTNNKVHIINPGTLVALVAPIFCKISLDSGELSISGVVGPLPGGSAKGSCGQIEMGFQHRNPAHNDCRYGSLAPPSAISFSEGWDADKWLDFLEYWHLWHLNHMQAACEHQTGPEYMNRQVNLYHWQTTGEADKKKKAVVDSVHNALSRGEAVQLQGEDLRLYNLQSWAETSQPEPPSPDYEPKKPLYVGDKGHVETKNLTSLRPAQHPDGILCRPCVVCGHKWGSGWLKREVPAQVIDFLFSLPVASKEPAWV